MKATAIRKPSICFPKGRELREEKYKNKLFVIRVDLCCIERKRALNLMWSLL